jgi:signal transduction histidine kinase/ligand-binding sensor domain-containing protein/DNA-binding NarL/FixJ family response regulator
MSIPILLLFFASLQDSIPSERPSPWPYQHVDKKAKLSNSAITSVYMDRHNQVWLGTWDGLDRYDGSSIKVYKPDPFAKGSLSNNIIRSLLEDGFGNLWVITHQGINKYNPSTDSFESYLQSLTNVPFLENNIRACVGEDSSLWVSAIGKGVSRFSKEKNDFVDITIKGVTQSWMTSVTDLSFHHGLLFLLGTDRKLVCTLDSRVVYIKQLNEIDAIFFHKFVNLGEHSFLSVVGQTGELQFYNLDDIEQPPHSVELGQINVSSLSENLKNTAIWVGTEAGDVFKVTHANGKFVSQNLNSYFPQFSQSKIKILTITETDQDLIWIGTDGGGVYKFLMRPKAFYSIQSGAVQNGALSHEIVRAVYEETDGTIYVGTRGGGLNIVHLRQNKTEVITTQNGLSNNAVLAINKDHRDNYWIGVDGEGIDMIEAKTKKIFHFPRDFDNHPKLSFGAVYSICIDAFNDVWLGTSGYGIVRLQISRTSSGRYSLKEFDQINATDKDEPKSLKSNIVYSIVEEKPNILWFGTRGRGVYRYNSLSKKIEENIQSDGPELTRLCNNDVLSMHLDDKEQLWIGTSGGLNRLQLQTKPYRIDYFTERDGLPNNTIHGVLHDAAGSIWVSTNRGLVWYQPTENKFTNFDTNDGLVNGEFTDGASFQSTISERLFFGGTDGVEILYPSKLNKVNSYPKLAITDFEVRNKAVQPGDDSGILTTSINSTTGITLAHDQNFIRFSFTALDYWSKEKTQYSYFLENFDKEWNNIGQQQTISLTNIPPGNYQLFINSTNENGSWSPNPRVLSITVLPPIWKTPWAFAIYVLLAIALQLLLITYIRARGKQKRNSAIEQLKVLQLKELNDHKLQFFTNVAHEFRTPLTLILGPVVSLLKKSTEVKERFQLKNIYNNSLRLQKLIDELMHFRKIESGKDELKISKVDLVSVTQQIVESFQEYASERDVQLEFLPESDQILGYVDILKIEKIWINLISNAIKYSPGGSWVRVSIRQRLNQLELVVKDDGFGIENENQEKIFQSFYQHSRSNTEKNGFAKSTGIGLSLTKSLVLIHRGEIRLESVVGKGSTFTVMIPITEDSYPKQQLETSGMVPLSNLKERISLEFDATQIHDEEQAERKEENPAEHRHSLLVVDDNEPITSLLENILSDRYKIYKASDGRKALAVLEANQIDLVISDIWMPAMDGLLLCKMIKENIQTSHIPVILLTAKSEIEDRIEGLQVGADSYIPKPFHPEHLFVRIEKLLEQLEASRNRFKNFANLELKSITTGISEKEDRFFMKITNCIQGHLSDIELNADTIAEEVGMSKASLYKKVKTITGLTPHGLIKQYRLKKAGELLTDSEMSVSEVIDEVGFNSRSYFYKSFNEMFHCHPKDYGEKEKSQT